ncbi:pyridine nucleotide-disulfide oxidoreductase, partial [bacterium]|nr:pyridine nucleotide-disulfide oxidoreductase [bacterium]
MNSNDFVWIDASAFQNFGGWVVDTQFVHLMGSAYLISAGTGRPVLDASTMTEVAEAGKWRVWVRSKNWFLDHAPGRFQVLVNGKALGRVFGQADSEEWRWEPG